MTINKVIDKLEKISNLLWHTAGFSPQDTKWIHEAAKEIDKTLVDLKSIEKVTGEFIASQVDLYDSIDDPEMTFEDFLAENILEQIWGE